MAFTSSVLVTKSTDALADESTLSAADHSRISAPVEYDKTGKMARTQQMMESVAVELERDKIWRVARSLSAGVNTLSIVASGAMTLK